MDVLRRAFLPGVLGQRVDHGDEILEAMARLADHQFVLLARELGLVHVAHRGDPFLDVAAGTEQRDRAAAIPAPVVRVRVAQAGIRRA